jgi:hypothetical protein
MPIRAARRGGGGTEPRAVSVEMRLAGPGNTSVTPQRYCDHELKRSSLSTEACLKTHKFLALTAAVIILLIELLGLNDAMLGAAQAKMPAAIASAPVDKTPAPGR